MGRDADRLQLTSTLHRAKGHLYWFSVDAEGNEPLPKLAESWCGFDLAPVGTVDVFGTAPEYLCGGSSAWPEHDIQVRRVRLLGPQVDLSAEDQVLLVLRNSAERVVRVDELPILARRAIVRVWKTLPGQIAGAERQPCTMTTVKVLNAIPKKKIRQLRGLKLHGGRVNVKE